MYKQKEIIILGAGLTGLTAAYYLRGQNVNVRILEARDRIGGRILTLDKSTHIEMGATWLGKKHIHLIALLDELEVKIFPQHFGKTAVYEPISTSPPQIVQLPPNNDPSYRISGGTIRIIDALKEQLRHDQITLNKKVVSITEAVNQIVVATNSDTYHCDIVISTLPPALFIDSIQVTPKLPKDVIEIAGHTHTWMSDSIKVALSYKEPFWQKDNLSGTIFSAVGPVPEMYDHSDVHNTQFALMGFFNGSYFKVSKEERLQLVLKQLRKYYGAIVDSYESYEELVWHNEEYTTSTYAGHVLPHENNGHQVFQLGYLGNKFFFAGSETSPLFSGYMDGAVHSAQKTVEHLLAVLP